MTESNHTNASCFRSELQNLDNDLIGLMDISEMGNEGGNNSDKGGADSKTEFRRNSVGVSIPLCGM